MIIVYHGSYNPFCFYLVLVLFLASFLLIFLYNFRNLNFGNIVERERDSELNPRDQNLSQGPNREGPERQVDWSFTLKFVLIEGPFIISNVC